MKCKETLFDHPYPWTTQHLLRTIYNIVNEEKYKIYYNGEKLKQIEATKKTPYRSGVHQKSQMKVTILPRQQSKPQYQTRGKTYGTATDPKKTQRAESLHSKFAATWQGNRLHSKFTANANPHHGPGDVLAKAFTTWSNQKPTHTKREPYSNVTTGNSSDKKDTRQLVICEFRGSTNKPDGKVHFRYSSHNSERPQTQHSAKIRDNKVNPSIKPGAKLTGQ